MFAGFQYIVQARLLRCGRDVLGVEMFVRSESLQA